MNIDSTLRVLQLVTCGAIVGLFTVKGLGLIGVSDIPLRGESVGAGVGALSVAFLRLLHRI